MSNPAKRLRYVRHALSYAAIVLVGIACDDQRAPTGPQQLPTIETAQRPRGGGIDEIFSSRLKYIDPAVNELLSSPDEHARGRYRFRMGATPPEAIAREDYLVTEADTAVLRLVLSADVVGDELVLETAPGFWHDVVTSGAYGFSAPIAPGAPATLHDGRVLPAFKVGPATLPIPPLSHTFDTTNVCAWIEEQIRKVCGEDFIDKEFGTGVVVKINGQIDSLVILGGQIGVSGDMDVTVDIDEGGFTGGTPPTFSPCNRGAYLGCITTPTGAAFFDWLRQFAPNIPEASLPPVRLCVPGTPVRVRAGYWDYSGFFPVWRLPVFEQCRIASVGVLPTVVLPTVHKVRALMRPRTKGDMTLRVRGDGKIGLTISTPIGYNAAYVLSSRAYAKAEAGVFVIAGLSIKNTGGTARAEFDRTDEILQEWTEAAGWVTSHEPLKKERSMQILEIDNPDSVVFKLGAKLGIGAELCAGIVKCDTAKSSGDETFKERLRIEAGVGAAVSGFGEAIWHREPVNPGDPLNDNWNVSNEFAYDLTVEAKLKLPSLGWGMPPLELLDFDKTWECCRVRTGDLWGRGRLRVTTTTTGTNLDPDGYELTIERADTLPPVIKSGPLRVGPAYDHGEPFQESLPSNGEVLIGPEGPVPCVVWYTDALFAGNPVWGLALQGLRATGLDLPGRAVVAPFCNMLIARHKLTVSGVAANCTVAGGNVQEVWLQQNNVSIGRLDNEKEFALNVTCGAAVPVGGITINTASVTAPSLSADFVVSVDETPGGLIGPTASRTLTGVPAGERLVTLAGGPSNCEPPPPQLIVVPDGGTVVVDFVAACTLPPNSVGLEATTNGTGVDEDGYALLLDGQPAAALPMNGLGVLLDVPRSAPSVVHVSGLADHCRAVTPTPFIVTPPAATDPITLPFEVQCTPLPIVTRTGTIEKDAGALSPVLLRLADGSLRSLTGPARADLAQLAGASVLVRGVEAGTTLSVFSHEFVPSDGLGRWSGIVLVRGAETWLLGERALLLVDAPLVIRNLHGAMIWVSGTETDAGITAQYFGIMRVAP